jgi:hypothetical protein
MKLSVFALKGRRNGRLKTFNKIIGDSLVIPKKKAQITLGLNFYLAIMPLCPIFFLMRFLKIKS